MSSLLELSHELLHCIFCEIEPADLSALSRTCRDLNSYIRGNRLLHKDLYVRRFDEPRLGGNEPEWEKELQNLVKLEKILECEGRENKADYLQYVADGINRLIETAATDHEVSLNLGILSEYFNDRSNIDAFLCASALFERAGTENQKAAATRKLQQASAKLHCLFGVPIDHIPKRSSITLHRPNLMLSPSSCTRLQSKQLPTHSYARSKVYDLRQYTDGTFWGPFLDDGKQTVDWEKVEAIMIVLGFNLNKFTERSDNRWPRVWHKPFAGATPNSYLSLEPAAAPVKENDDELLQIREMALSLDAQDPYGVSGTWMRVVCFLDYNDLYAFNFSQRILPEELREPIDTEEGIIDLEEIVRTLLGADVWCSHPTDQDQAASYEN